MKKSLITLLQVICAGQFLYAQVTPFEKQWDQRFGGTEEDIVGHFEITSDSGFIISGTSFSGISGIKSQDNYDTTLTTADFWLVKTDSAGGILWDKTLGGNLSEFLSETIITMDGGLLSGGQSFSDSSGDKSQPNRDVTLQSNDYWIIKTDAAGIKLWDKCYGGDSFELFGAIRELAGGGFIITGSSFSGISGDKTALNKGAWDYWVIRTDADGNKLWDKCFGGTDDDFSNMLVITADSNLVVGGYSTSGIGGDKTQGCQGNNDFWIIKVDLNGNKLWDKTFGGNNNDWLFALTATSDGGLIIGGQSFSGATGDKSEPNHDPNASGSDRWIVKTDSDGIKQWDRTIGGTETDDLSRIIQTTDGGYLISGESYSDSSGNKTETNLGPEQTWIVKTDSTGLIEWDKTLFTYGHDETGTALPFGDDCFVVVNFTQADTGGYKSEIGWGNGDYWMIKMCETSPLSTHELTPPVSGWSAIPNPFADELVLYSQSMFETVTVELIDAGGRLIRAVSNIKCDGNTISMKTMDVPPGFYICRIIESQKVYNIRVVKRG